MSDTPPRLRFDAASAISQGGRDYQEDAIISDFSNGAEICLAVLADGMGGHAAGDIASKIVVTEVFSELTFQREEFAKTPANLADKLLSATASANTCLCSHMEAHPETKGMGATLVACVVINDRLHWVSVGDSPLFLFRDNSLTQLNEDHSLGPHIDLMVRSGVISEQEGENHPERNVLTSVLAGQPKIAQVDCPEQPFLLKGGDTVIVASDGLQYLSNDVIAQVLREKRTAPSAYIADALMTELRALEDPDLDNISLTLFQVSASRPLRPPAYSGTRDGIGAALSRHWPFGRREPPASPLPSSAHAAIGQPNAANDL